MSSDESEWFLRSIFPPLKFLSMLSLFLFLPGCIGIGIVGIGDSSMTHIEPEVIMAIEKRMLHNKGEVLTSSVIESQWGPPDDREQVDGGGEIWKYRGSKLRWHGVVPLILIPIPLVVPFGHEYVTFDVRGGQVVSAVDTSWGFTYRFACAYFMLGIPPIGCEAKTK